jgi:hypothetical protein
VSAAGLLPALLLGGPASDRRGRRAVALPFVVLSALASLTFLPGPWLVERLFVGRFLQGMVSGVVFGVGSAWVADVTMQQGAARAADAARRTTIALSAGFALGPLAGGLLGQWAPAPLATPYLVHVALLVTGLVLLLRVPDVSVPSGTGPLLDLGIPAGAGRPFAWFVLPVGLCVFTFPSLSITVLPLELQRAMQGFDVAVTGVVAALTMSAGVLVQPFARRRGPVAVAWLAPVAGGAGILVAVAAAAVDLWPALLPAAVLLGAGYGLSLVAGLTATERLADPAQRGALTASFYAIAYLGFATPTLVAWGGTAGDLSGRLLVVAGLALVLAVVLAAPGRRRMPPARPPS